MSEAETAPAGGGDSVESIPATAPAQGTNFDLGVSEAAKQLSNYRWKRDNPEAAKAEEAKAAPAEAAAEPESAQAESDPPQEAPAQEQTTEQPEPATEPPIERPRSWTKDEDTEWQSLPRAMQQKIVAREQERDTGLRRSQNEAAEKLKGLTAKEQQVEQARQQYEAALPALLETMQSQQMGEFSDIKTMADVEKLAREDWPRYALWDAQQKKIAAVSQEVAAAKTRQETEFKSKWAEFASKEDAALLEKVPELADKAKSQKIADGAVNVLKDVGFSEGELAKAWNGETSVSLRDHRIQLLIVDALKYREAKTNTAKPAVKPVAPVIRPGVAKTANSGDAEIQALTKRFESSGSIKDAAALRVARQRARA